MFNADIKDWEEYLLKAIRRGKRTYRNTYKSLQYGSKFKKMLISEQARFNTIYQVLENDLKKITEEFPPLHFLPQFYQDLIPLIVNYREVRRSVQRVKYLIKIIRKIYMESLKNLKTSKNIQEILKAKKEFYGRLYSVFKRNSKIFEILREAEKSLRRLPKIKSSPTIVIAGLPNVGKSTLLKNLTGSEPEIQPYPFTTKDIMLGYLETPYTDIQIVDTPGILDRNFEELNDIERKSLVAIKDLANLIIYVFDVTETCGYSIEEQKSLLRRIISFFENKEIWLYFSKKDLNYSNFEDKKKELANLFNLPSYDSVDSLREEILGWIKRNKNLII